MVRNEVDLEHRILNIKTSVLGILGVLQQLQPQERMSLEELSIILENEGYKEVYDAFRFIKNELLRYHHHGGTLNLPVQDRDEWNWLWFTSAEYVINTKEKETTDA